MTREKDPDYEIGSDNVPTSDLTTPMNFSRARNSGAPSA